MSTYEPKKLINGFRLGAQYGGTFFVAIPKRKIESGPVLVKFDNKTMTIYPDDEPVARREFDDKFGRGKYSLNYYAWIHQTESEKT